MNKISWRKPPGELFLAVVGRDERPVAVYQSWDAVEKNGWRRNPNTKILRAEVTWVEVDLTAERVPDVI